LIASLRTVLSKEDKTKLLEGLKMSEIARWLREEGRKEGRKEGWDKGREQTAKAALRKGYPVDEIVDITGFSEETVLRLKREVEQERLAQGVPVMSR